MMIEIGVELRKQFITEGVDPSEVTNVETINDKKRRLIITKITLIDGSKHELTEEFVWYASRKNKRW